MDKKYTFDSFKNTTPELVAEIRELEKHCNQHDNTHYQLFLENTLNEDREIDFIYIFRWEGEIVSMMLLFFPDLKEIEVYGYTAPEYRRNGLFSRLFTAVGIVFSKYEFCSYLFTCDQDSGDGKKFLDGMDTNLEEIEYMMELDLDSFNNYLDGVNSNDYSIIMECGSIDQLEEIGKIASVMYGEEKLKSLDFVSQTINSENKEQMIGLVDGNIVGICTVGTEDDFAMISGMAIVREYQGRGLGRELLNQAVFHAIEKYNCPIKLEVSSVNDKAFNLYKSVGFKKNESYGYYRLK